jgi:hypothetical protein
MKHKNGMSKRQLRKFRKMRDMRDTSILVDPQELLELYPSQDCLDADLQLLADAQESHYGEVPEGFLPPAFVGTDIGNLRVAPWGETFHELLVGKYGLSDPDSVSRRFRLVLGLYGAEMLAQSSAIFSPVGVGNRCQDAPSVFDCGLPSSLSRTALPGVASLPDPQI